MINFVDALNAIIDDGIEAARLDYVHPHDKVKLDGAIRGFEDCRGKSPVEIAVLLAQARKSASEEHRPGSRDYWYWRCRENEIEWVANVLSALLMGKGLPILVPVTIRGMLKAIDIAGIRLVADETKH